MKELNSSELISRTKSLVSKERQATLELIQHLAEINRRMLYAELGFSSLWEFATLELGLSEGAAQRRIQAMRLLRDAPEVAQALQSGALSLSNAAKVQSFRQAEKKRGKKPDASELVAKVIHQSQRECEKTLFAISPEALPSESERVVSAQNEHKLTMIVSPKLHEKLQRLKGLLAHTLPDSSYAELLDHLATQALTRLEKEKGVQAPRPVAAKPATTRSTAPSKSATSFASSSNSIPATATAPTAAAAVKLPAPGKRGYLPAPVRKQVWTKSGGRCEFMAVNRRCSSKHRLEIDHITPLAQGGSSELSNLRLLCWHHNQQQAREKHLHSPHF